MGEGSSFKDEAARLGATYQRNLEELRRHGYLRRRRLHSDYKMTTKGAVYLRDVCQRDDEVRQWVSHHAEKWEAGEVTEVERETAQIELIAFGLHRDLAREAESVADLQAQGFDVAAALRSAGYDRAPPES